tara:strand:+ start:119 stop:316 length:198 start_codon:yes stop_codon:yes gene_type:complete
VEIGNIVKLIINPSVDWMHKYLDETFEVIDFPTENGVRTKMVGADPEWQWIIGKADFEIAEEEDE